MLLSSSVSVALRAEVVGPRLCCIDIFVTALSMLDLVHLSTIKRFNEKFVTMALQVPSSWSLHPPTLHETVQADRSVWVRVAQRFCCATSPSPSGPPFASENSRQHCCAASWEEAADAPG